jgi:hypothetical protein
MEMDTDADAGHVTKGSDTYQCKESTETFSD